MYLHIYTSVSQVLKLPETFVNEKKIVSLLNVSGNCYIWLTEVHIKFVKDLSKMESAKSHAWHACVLACLHAHVLGLFACLRAWRVCMLTSWHAWHVCVFVCLHERALLTCFLRCVLGVFTIDVPMFLSNYLFCLHKSRLCN